MTGCVGPASDATRGLTPLYPAPLPPPSAVGASGDGILGRIERWCRLAATKGEDFLRSSTESSTPPEGCEPSRSGCESSPEGCEPLANLPQHLFGVSQYFADVSPHFADVSQQVPDVSQ